jgi:hypothetical protein
MNIQRYRRARFIKKEDLESPIRVTITGAEEVDYSKVAGEMDFKIVIDFETEQGDKFRLKLNDTNLDAVAKAYGDETDNWIRKPIILRHDPTVEMDHQVVGGTRISIPAEEASKRKKPTLKRQTSPTPAPVGKKIDDDGDEIPF